MAIAIPESGGLDPNAWNQRGEDSRGLWQINVAPNASPGYAGWNLFDPAICARVAFVLSKGGTDFSPWTTYTLGVYLQYVPQVRAALNHPEPPPMTDLLTNRSAWLWQFDGTAERTIEGLAATCQAYADTPIVLVKCMDGQGFMAGPDTASAAISGYDVWEDTVRRGRAAGLTLYPWVNPRSPDDAAAHARLGPVLLVDAEPYPGFFEDGRSPTLATDFTRYLTALRAGGVAQLYVSIDPRPSAMQALGVAQWAGSVDGLLPQFYWTDFQVAPDAPSMIACVQALAALNVPVVPVLPANGAAGDMARFMAVTGGRYRGVSLWRLGEADAAHLTEFAAIPVTGGDPTPPTPQPDTRLARIADLLRQALAVTEEPAQ